MAVTKTHPIKSTLKAAIDYILNPEKTDGKLLASSFGCGLETADIEFAWTREAAGDRGTHLGRHLIQSFAVGETTPEEAHKIGMELAGAVLGGKYEFVLTTHVDKEHLHNHLIFNAVSFVDYKKYHSNKQSYHAIRRTSDRICKEHGLSVVVPGQDKGKSYAEYTAEKQGTSYKAKLKTAIDTLIPQVKDFDELLRRLQEMGYEIKQGKYISLSVKLKYPFAPFVICSNAIGTGDAFSRAAKKSSYCSTSASSGLTERSGNSLPSVCEISKTVITLKAGTVISFSSFTTFPSRSSMGFLVSGSILSTSFFTL